MPAFAAGGFIAPAWPDAQVYLLIPFSHECTQSSHVLLPAPNAGRARRWDLSHQGPSHVRNPSCLPGSVSRKLGCAAGRGLEPRCQIEDVGLASSPLPKTAPAAPAPSQGPCVHQRADQQGLPTLSRIVTSFTPWKPNHTLRPQPQLSPQN